MDRHPKSPDPTDVREVKEWINRQPRPWAIDLFCGAGGLSLGLEEAGFSVIAAADSDATATETHAANFPGLTWTGDLAIPAAFMQQLDQWGVDSVDLLAGGPPCQPFSSAGFSKIGDLVRKGVRDPRDARAGLWHSFFAFVDRLNPKAVLFENVPDFARVQGGALLMALCSELRNRGYGVHVRMLKAWHFRVPQHRTRIFVVGIANNRRFEWPHRIGRTPKVKQAISDLPIIHAGCRDEIQRYLGPTTTTLARELRKRMGRGEAGYVRDHVARRVRADDAKIYKGLNPGDTYLDVPDDLKRYRSDTFTDKYERMTFDGLSRTITAHIAKDGYAYIHPREDRTLSIRESARIQTFPDRFRFAGHPTNRYRQIGNAVPSLLARAIAQSVRDALTSDSSELHPRTNARCRGDNFRRDLDLWFQLNKRAFVWRDRRIDAWQTLLIEMCLHRTKADQVEVIANRLLESGSTPESFVTNFNEVEPLLDTLGLKWRTKNMLAAANFVSEKFDNAIPDSWHGLIAIPGVGDYIASAVLCFAFDQKSVLVDTNTLRIARRVVRNRDAPIWRLRIALGELSGHTGPNEAWNQALLDLGALVCTARVAKCEICPVQAHCATGIARSKNGRWHPRAVD